MNIDDVIAKLEDLHAPIRVPGIGEYQLACGVAARLLREIRDTGLLVENKSCPVCTGPFCLCR